MDKSIKDIHGYYSPNDLYNKIIEGLNKLGTDLSEVTLDDLQPVDEFHIRGDSATRELIELSGFTPDMHILDVGCGIGGSTRRLAHETGCRVTGIDLSDEYIDAAERLTQLLNMQERVKFHAASALALPFDDDAFDGVWSLQMNMNVEDKLSWLRETCRVLKPGGILGVVQHRAAPGSDPSATAQSGYVPEQAVIDLARQAGLYLEARSEVNANPRDSRDHPKGVWTLPPSLDADDGQEAKYKAIGESDRMTLRFVRPRAD